MEDAQMAVRTQEEFNDFAAEKLRLVEAQQEAFKEQLALNTALTAEVLAILDAAKTFFRFANWTGRAIKWIAGVAAACVALYQIWKGHA